MLEQKQGGIDFVPSFPARVIVVTLIGQLILAVTLLTGSAGTGRAGEAQLGRFLPELSAAALVPGADRLGPIEGTPPAAPAYAGTELKGWVLLNSDVVNAVGYSGKPIRIAIGIDTRGVITGAKLVEHHEPIVLVGIPPRRSKPSSPDSRARTCWSRRQSARSSTSSAAPQSPSW